MSFDKQIFFIEHKVSIWNDRNCIIANVIIVFILEIVDIFIRTDTAYAWNYIDT